MHLNNVNHESETLCEQRDLKYVNDRVRPYVNDEALCEQRDLKYVNDETLNM